MGRRRVAKREKKGGRKGWRVLGREKQDGKEGWRRVVRMESRMERKDREGRLGGRRQGGKEGKGG